MSLVSQCVYLELKCDIAVFTLVASGMRVTQQSHSDCPNPLICWNMNLQAPSRQEMCFELQDACRVFRQELECKHSLVVSIFKNNHGAGRSSSSLRVEASGLPTFPKTFPPPSPH